MAQIHRNLPQLTGDIFLTDAGLETDFIFNKGVDIQEFCGAHPTANSRDTGTTEKILH
jgi:hypothetical protein